MRRILITGAAGFIPSSLIDKLISIDDIFIVAFDNLLTGRISNLPYHNSNRYRFIKGNVNSYEDISQVMLAYNFDYVFHYAAVVGVKRTLANPLLVLEDIKGFENILTLSKNTGVQRVFFSSSSEVYGEPVEFPQNEQTTPLNSKLPYAIVKNVGEAFIRSFQAEHNLSFTIFRFFNTYGPKQSPDFVLSKFLYAAYNNQDLTIYGDGLQTRTFCYIDDNIEMALRCLNEGLGINEVINVGSDKETSIIELANLILDLTNSSSRVIHLPPLAQGDMRRRCPDNSRMLALLGRSLQPLDSGIQAIIDYHKST